METADKLSAEDVLKRIVAVITPAVLQIVAGKESGPIKIEFHEGQYKRASYKKSL